jgi:hypothetical protein
VHFGGSYLRAYFMGIIAFCLARMTACFSGSIFAFIEQVIR